MYKTGFFIQFSDNFPAAKKKDSTTAAPFPAVSTQFFLIELKAHNTVFHTDSLSRFLFSSAVSNKIAVRISVSINSFLPDIFCHSYSIRIFADRIISSGLFS